MQLVKRLFEFLASYGLACALLFLFLLLVLFGTLEQVNEGLFQVQNRYFASMFLIHWIRLGAVSLPLPLVGGYPLMVLLFVNLTLGAIIRAPKSWRHPGMLIAHGGIIFLCLAAGVTFWASEGGHMTLYEHDSSAYYDDYYQWEVAITELGKTGGARTFSITDEQLKGMDASETRSFKTPELPFTLELSNWMPNSNVRQLAPMLKETGFDGVHMESVPVEKEAEKNLAGATAKVIPNDGSTPLQSYLWGFSVGPWAVKVGDNQYGITLRHVRRPLPFTITLEKFIRDLHPRTMMAANFESVVTKTEDNSSRKINIRMNEPLRYKGYTFFQASWGPQDARPGDPLFSTFAVVRNPADQWPKYACYVIGLGLLIHFAQKLGGYIRAQNRRRSA